MKVHNIRVCKYCYVLSIHELMEGAVNCFVLGINVTNTRLCIFLFVFSVKKLA